MATKARIGAKAYGALLWGALLMVGITPPSYGQLSDSMLDRELAAPGGIGATPGLGRIVVSWERSVDEGIIGYNVYRSPRYDGEYEMMVGGEGTPFTTSGTTYIDSGLVVGETFFYRVTSVTALQESPFSEIAGAAVEQRAISDFDTEFSLTPAAPSMDSASSVSMFDMQTHEEKGFFTGRRLAGLGFLVGSAGLVYKGFDFKDQADKLYDRYKSASDPTEIDRLYQRTTNRDVKSQISWALGAACAVAGVRLVFFGGEEKSSLPTAYNQDGRIQWHAQVDPGEVRLGLSHSF